MVKKVLPLVQVGKKTKRVSNSKIVGWLMFFIAVGSAAVDILNGGDFDFNKHINNIWMALNGLSVVFIRQAIQKVEHVIF